MDWKIFLNQDPRLSGLYQRTRAKPAWPTLAAVASAAIVIVVPVVLVLLAGLAVGLVVYAVGSAVAGVGNWFKSLGGDTAQGSAMEDDLRENVRVVRR
ncbi:MAG: hypothetical protein AAF086_00435 [Planctomycetota bacterium]